jgi:hypothetical protein
VGHSWGTGVTESVIDGAAGATETAAGKQDAGRWKPGQSGNPSGRPPGARNRASVLAEQMLTADVENIVRTVIDRAVGGDTTCLRLCLERLLPPVRERSVEIPLPDVATVADAVAAMTVVVGRVASGDIAPGEAAAVASVVETFRRTVETQDLERRIAELEAGRGQR